MDCAPQGIEKINQWKQVYPTELQRLQYAKEAMSLRWDEYFDLDPINILRPRRYEDRGSDLWTTYNVVQENLLKGGITFRNMNGHKSVTRGIRGVNENVRLNRGLWDLTQHMENALNKSICLTV